MTEIINYADGYGEIDPYDHESEGGLGIYDPGVRTFRDVPQVVMGLAQSENPNLEVD